MSTRASLDALREGALAGTRELDLSNCGLREVPREVFALADTLEVLDLSGNALTALPHDMSQLTKLRALFCSKNSFARLPPVLGACAALSQIGFRASDVQGLPSESLPPALRWLTLTDNRLTHLPRALGERPLLQKLMLAGNRLQHLPESLENASNLELLRLSANRFEALPAWLTDLPRLAWLAWAGNPFEDRHLPSRPNPVPWLHLQLDGLLGEGASGQIYRALWHPGNNTSARPVALKLFKGSMTSDGLPECEMAAGLAAGNHPNLVGSLGLLTDHPDGVEGLIMPLVPNDSRVLAGPPSLSSCSRDVYNPALRFEGETVVRLARDIAAATAHLHTRGLSHGDLYAHNILWSAVDSAALLSDFGAASFMPGDQAPALQRLDVLAWGILLGELVERADGGAAELQKLQRDCVQTAPCERPSMADVMARLQKITPP